MSPDAALAGPPLGQEADLAAYTRSPYPTLLHPTTHPERLAAIALLHGMRAAAVPTARVLEIGCGDGMNLLAMAQAFPEARFTGIDILAGPIALGQERARRAGLRNVELRVADILDEQFAAGSYDYIIAHGVYAWVPPAVSDAVINLIGRQLSPDGVALVSYNALPGSFIRVALRDAMLAEIGAVTDTEERLRLARSALQRIVDQEQLQDNAQRALQDEAQATLRRSGRVLLHDELSENFRPQYVRDVIAAGRRAGLKFLSDATAARVLDGALPADVEIGDDPDAQVAERVGRGDVAGMRYFRSTLFVREHHVLPRRIQAGALDALWIGLPAADRDGQFKAGGFEITITEPSLLKPLRDLAAIYPQRRKYAEVGFPAGAADAMVMLFNMNIVTLSLEPFPGAVDTGAVPVVSPLARVMLEDGLGFVATLDFRQLDIGAEGQAFVRKLDGTISLEEMAGLAAEHGIVGPERLDEELAGMRRLGIFVA